MSNKPTKCDRLLQLLSDGREHGQREVLEAAGFRYTGRLKELRDAGHDIQSIHVQGSEWRFQLVSQARQLALLALFSDHAQHHMKDVTPTGRVEQTH